MKTKIEFDYTLKGGEFHIDLTGKRTVEIEIGTDNRGNYYLSIWSHGVVSDRTNMISMGGRGEEFEAKAIKKYNETVKRYMKNAGAKEIK